jgi:hypothetical protein
MCLTLMVVGNEVRDGKVTQMEVLAEKSGTTSTYAG